MSPQLRAVLSVFVCASDHKKKKHEVAIKSDHFEEEYHLFLNKEINIWNDHIKM